MSSMFMVSIQHLSRRIIQESAQAAGSKRRTDNAMLLLKKATKKHEIWFLLVIALNSLSLCPSCKTTTLGANQQPCPFRAFVRIRAPAVSECLTRQRGSSPPHYSAQTPFISPLLSLLLFFTSPPPLLLYIPPLYICYVSKSPLLILLLYFTSPPPLFLYPSSLHLSS